MRRQNILSIALVLAGCSEVEPAEERTILRTVEEIEQFASFEEMVLAADLMIEGEVVSIDPGRVVGTPDHREELAVATVRVSRVLFRGAELASPPEQVAIEFHRFVDIAGHGRRRIVRSDGGDEYELGEVGFYALRRAEGGAYRTVSIQGRIPVRQGRVDAPEAATALAGRDPAVIRLRIEEAARQTAAQ